MADKQLDWGLEMSKMRRRQSDFFKLCSNEIQDGIPLSNNTLDETARVMTGIVNVNEAKNTFLSFFETFKNGDKVLILGAGGNSLVQDLIARFPNINFLSLDLKYFLGVGQEDRTDHMFSANWEKLPFDDKSLNGVFSHLSFPYWATNQENLRRGVSEVSRVMKKGAKWYFDGKYDDEIFISFCKKEKLDVTELALNREAQSAGEMAHFTGKAVKK